MVIGSTLESVPKTKGILKTRRVPWWNIELAAAIIDKKTALRLYRRTKLVNDKIAFNRARAKVRYLIKSSTTISWKKYVSSINEKTPLGRVWAKIGKIRGKRTGIRKPILETDNGTVADPKEVANIFGDALSEISEGCKIPQFQRLKRTAETRPLSFAHGEDEVYNVPFKMAELDNALKLSANTSPGDDGVYYLMIRHLPELSMIFLLALFNRIWYEGVFPTTWRTAVVIPFAKPGKDPSDPDNYRPIALTSCICKLLERIVNVRLVFTLEQANIISRSQYGFRRNRSTTDVLARIDSFIKGAFARREHVVAFFLTSQRHTTLPGNTIY